MGVLEIGDETGEAVAWLPAGQYGLDVRETGKTTPAVHLVSVISQLIPERQTRSSHSCRRVRRHGGGLPSHVAVEDLAPFHSRATGPGHWSRLPKIPRFPIRVNAYKGAGVQGAN